MDFLQITILALIQGLTEFLPVSSSGHLALTPILFNWQDSSELSGLVIDAFLHLGTLAAVLIYFRQELLDLVLKKEQRKNLGYIIIATLPVVFVGFGFKEFFESSLIRSGTSIALSLSLGAVALWLSDKNSKQQLSLIDLNFWQIFFIGSIQILALFPGFSRSGACLIAGLLVGLKREAAARFAFLVGVPAVGGAGLLACKDIFDYYQGINLDTSAINELWILAAGLALSFISGLIAVDVLIKFLRKSTVTVFCIYRLILAATVLFFSNAL